VGNGGDPLGQLSSDPFDFVGRVAGCNPVESNYRTTLPYINLSCFTLPQATPAIAARCQTFGFKAPDPNNPLDTGNTGIAGTCANLQGNAGRKAVVRPGLLDFDFSLFKNNYIPRISESFNVQFPAEFFNVLNHPNFQSPIANESPFDASGAPVGGAGTLNATSTDPRQKQCPHAALLEVPLDESGRI
jgi:hypothetical protein